MRHQKKGKTLDRDKESREAMLRNLATSLVIYEKMKTTSAKAKVIKPIVEKLITLSKDNNLTTRRKLIRVLYHKNAIKKMLEVLGPRYKDRKGGYLRIIKLGRRQGDGAQICQIEMV